MIWKLILDILVANSNAFLQEIDSSLEITIQFLTADGEWVFLGYSAIFLVRKWWIWRKKVISGHDAENKYCLAPTKLCLAGAQYLQFLLPPSLTPFLTNTDICYACALTFLSLPIKLWSLWNFEFKLLCYKPIILTCLFAIWCD